MPNICYSTNVSWTDCYAWAWVHQCSGHAGGTCVSKVTVFILRKLGKRDYIYLQSALLYLFFCQTKAQSLCLCEEGEKESIWSRLPFLQGNVLGAPGQLMHVHTQRISCPLPLTSRRMLSMGQGASEKGAARGAAGCYPILCARKKPLCGSGLLYS